MKKIYFLKNKVFRKDEEGNLILNNAGKKMYRRDVGYSVAKALEEKLGKKVIITDDDTKAHNNNSVMVNWGRSKGQNLYGNIINNPFAVKNCVRKDKTYSILDISNVPIPAFAFSKEVGFSYIKEGGCVIRHVVDGKGGEGVEVVLNNDKYKSLLDFPDAPLYTKFYNKTHEIRLHVYHGEILQIVEKKRIGKAKREDQGIVLNEHVRNHSNGWALVKNDVTPILSEDRTLKVQAVRAIQRIGLTFGAVDMMVRLDKDCREVLDCAIAEVNTAPGIEGSTLELYVDRMANHINSLIEGY